MPGLNELVDKIRAKYPGAYDDLDDAALTKSVLAKYPQYSDLAAPGMPKAANPMESQTIDTPFNRGDYTHGLREAGDVLTGMLQNVAHVSTPGVAASLASKKFPQIQQQAKGWVAKPEDLPGEIVATGLPMMVGGEELPEAQIRPKIPDAAANEIASRVTGVIARRVPVLGRILKAKDFLSDLTDAIKGPEAAPEPTPAPPPTVPWKQIGQRQPPPTPTQDVIAANPGEQARLASVGSRMTQPVTLPSQNRGLALPAGAPEPSPAAAESPNISQGISTVPRTLSGQGVLNEALTSLDNKSLLKIARSRGVDVTAEAQLKPGIADQRIIKKITDSFTEDELEELRSQGLENSRFSPQPANIEDSKLARDLWHTKVLQAYFPDVAIPKALLGRAQKAQTMRLSDLLSVGAK
jgi:hypothetical protein